MARVLWGGSEGLWIGNANTRLPVHGAMQSDAVNLRVRLERRDCSLVAVYG